MNENQVNPKKSHSHWAEKTNHTRLKHLILESYLKVWSNILAKATFSNKQEDIYYIDGFAGRGVFLDGDRGSPLIAANEMFAVQKKLNEEFPDKPLRFHVINIEAEVDSYNMLQNFSNQNGNGVYINNILGSFKEESKKLLASRQIQASSCFWFVDPFYGARDFTFDDVIELLFEKGKPRFRKEVLINFMTYNIVRFLEHEVEKPYILKFLGASSVAEVLKEATLKENKKEQAIINYYVKMLREKGLYVITQRIQCKDPKSKDVDKIYFHMVHCSHNERALIEMRNAFVGVTEQKRAFEKKLEGDIVDFFDLGLMNPVDFQFSHFQLIKFIEERFGLKQSVNMKRFMTLILQEVPIGYEDLCNMLHELGLQLILQVHNIDTSKRRKPFHVDYKFWSNIEITLVKTKYIKPSEQLSIIDF